MYTIVIATVCILQGSIVKKEITYMEIKGRLQWQIKCAFY